MKVLNSMNLPQAFVNAVNLERHNEKGCYSATTLLKGSASTILTDRHFDEIEVDVADCVWQIWGTAVHKIFEDSGIDGLKEERFEVPVSHSKVTGRVDLFDERNGVLYDWKTASTYKCTFNDFSDWKKQGLIYAWLMKQNGIEVKKCRFIALLKDHSKSKAKTDSSYPQMPVYNYEFEVTEEELAEIENFIKTRIAELEKAELIPDEELAPCSEEERWQSPAKFAVMKEGRKTAIKLFDSKEEAESNMKALGGTYIEERKAEARRCSEYCSCNIYCPFYKKMVEGK
jgi:hypothetical protein